MSFGANVLVAVIGAVIGVGGTLFAQWLLHRQKQRDEDTERLRAIMSGIREAFEEIRERSLRVDGRFRADYEDIDKPRADYSGRLWAEPDSHLLSFALEAVRAAARLYGGEEALQHDYPADFARPDRLDKIGQNLSDAMDKLEQSLTAHMAKLDKRFHWTS